MIGLKDNIVWKSIMNFPLISFEGYDVNESASTLEPLISYVHS
jgi:hypothetical protein